MVNAELVDTTIQYVRKYHTIDDFILFNQNGDTITQEFYKDKIYIADFFFTTCLTICPIMTDHMLEIQGKIKNDPEVFLLSHTVIPNYDDVEQLKNMLLKKGLMILSGTWLPEIKSKFMTLPENLIWQQSLTEMEDLMI